MADELRKITPEELVKILNEHSVWLETDGTEGHRADLNDADLRYAHLYKANLSKANLFKSNLCGVTMVGSDLSSADLSEANLSGAFLSYSNLRNARLFMANLSDASLTKANLVCANLTGANLSLTDLRKADLSEATLSGANMQGAILSEALLENTNVSEVKFKRRRRGVRGARVATCYGSEKFKRFIQHEAFIEELNAGTWRERLLCCLWMILADCGRTPWLWIMWSILLSLYFGTVFYWMGPDAFNVSSDGLNDFSWPTMVYYSVVTFTTLGFGDVVPKTLGAAYWVMAEVITGYIMLGGLISIFTTKLVPRG